MAHRNDILAAFDAGMQHTFVCHSASRFSLAASLRVSLRAVKADYLERRLELLSQQRRVPHRKHTTQQTTRKIKVKCGLSVYGRSAVLQGGRNPS
jgi:hypothetical protein